MNDKENQQKKLEYKPPILKLFGKISSLTLGASGMGFDSGGNQPAMDFPQRG